MAAGIAAPSGERTPEEEQWLADRAAWQQNEAGYSAIQSTKPQSLAYGLMDSPAGLAAWIVEKWCSWSDCHGDIESRFSKDELLTNVMLYWVTGSIRSSMQMYHAHRTEPPVGMRAERIEVPTAVASFPAEIAPPPRSAVERKYNLVRWTEMQRGGHFAAMEEPAALVEDIRCFFRGVRKGSHA
jgi:pimeloyl-ACP methyl ester carboxylesterase